MVQLTMCFARSRVHDDVNVPELLPGLSYRVRDLIRVRDVTLDGQLPDHGQPLDKRCELSPPARSASAAALPMLAAPVRKATLPLKSYVFIS